MKAAPQRGFALLAVAMLLVVLGALAFMLSRQGAMAANAVGAQYDTEVARYLAEAGLEVAEWRARQLGCGRRDTLVKPSRIDAGGTYSAFISNGDKKLDIDATGATDGGARVALSRKGVIAHESDARQVVIGSGNGQDTFISAAARFTAQHSKRYLELSQNVSNALLQFDLPADLYNATIVSADLSLTQYQASTLPGQVSAHRLNRRFDPDWATWTSARFLVSWSSDGGDFSATTATASIDGNKAYSWDLTTLVDSWANKAVPNYGVLLQADGPLQQAQFYGMQSAQSKPTLRVTYYKAC